MAEAPKSNSTPAGLYRRSEPAQNSWPEAIGFGLAVVWLMATGWFFVTSETPIGDSVISLLGMVTVVFMPIAMVWVSVLLLRTARLMQQETRRLDASIEALRKAYIDQTKVAGHAPAEGSIIKKLEEISAQQKRAETALAIFTTTRSVLEKPAQNAADTQSEEQPALALGTQIEEVTSPLSKSDFIRALNFPETAQDEQGFAALRRALKDRNTGQLVQAAQDILTLLSQDGIYMDDLRPDMARPDIWRKLANGERGRQIAALGGIRDRSCLALTNGRMKQDPVFRDAAHHFLRLFDREFSKFEADASDREISALSETRTARAFMLLGRVAGTFN